MGGGGPETQTTRSGPPPWASKYGRQFLDLAASLFPGGQIPPYLEGMNQRIAPFTPDQLAGLEGIRGVSGDASRLGEAGAGNLEATLRGDYLSPESNPWLKDTAHAAARDLTNEYATATAPSWMAQGISASGGGPGALGGNSGFQEQQALNQYNLGQNLGNLEANIYGGNYARERGNQLQGLGLLGATQSAMYNPANMLLGAGSFEQQQQQNQLNANRQNTMQQANWPWQQLGSFGSIFNQLTGGSNTTISPNPAATK